MRNITVLYRMELPHRAISVHMYLSDRANKENTCWPSIPTIAKDLKLSESTTPAHLPAALWRKFIGGCFNRRRRLWWK